MYIELDERQLRLTLENVPLALLAHDETGRMRFLSREFLRLSGYRPEQIPTFAAWLDLAYGDPEVTSRVMSAHLEGYGDGPKALAHGGEYRVRIADGSTRTWLFRAYSIGRDAQGVAVNVSMAIDVTEARISEAALRDSEARLRMSLELSRVGVFDWNLVDDELIWDDRVREIWGLAPGEPVAMAKFYQGLHPGDVERLREVIAASHDPAGDGGYNVEYRVIDRRDGRVRHVSARGRTLFERGQPARMMGAVVDVTALREAAAVLKRDRDELEARVEARTRELAEAQTRLAQAQRLEALGQLAGGVAHDFNNVLQAIEAACDLIERKPDAQNLPRYLRMAREATKRGSAISRRLLSFSRRAELEPETVGSVGLLQDISGILKRTMGADVRIELETARDCPPVLCDRRQFETALLNIAANAGEAMDGRGVLRLVAHPETQIAAEASIYRARLRPGDYVRFEVADDGRGMDEDVRARALEPFFSTKPRGQGAGLGLSMARGFADQSGGALALRSEPGKGATVALWLPVASLVNAVAEAPGPAVGPKGRLMFVDDDPLVRELVGEQLRVAGFEVTVCCEGRSAIDKLDGGLTIDALVTDFAMPEMNGVVLAHEARKRQPRLPVALLTGYSAEAAEAADQADFTLIGKPIDAKALVARVAALISGG